MKKFKVIRVSTIPNKYDEESNSWVWKDKQEEMDSDEGLWFLPYNEVYGKKEIYTFEELTRELTDDEKEILKEDPPILPRTKLKKLQIARVGTNVVLWSCYGATNRCLKRIE